MNSLCQKIGCVIKLDLRCVMKTFLINANNQIDLVCKQISLLGEGMKQNRKQIVIVPDKYSLTMERRIMEQLNLTASMNFSVYTFATLSELYLKNSNAKVLSSLGATYVVQMLLNKHKSELKCFSKTNKSINFASVIFDNISQLKSCNITAESLMNASKTLENKLLASKIFDIAFIYQKYEEYLGTNFVDSSNKLALLSEKIAVSDKLDDVDVHICHFDNMTKKNLMVVEQLIKRAHSVSIGCVVPEKKQNNKHLFKSQLMEDVLEICNNLHTTPNIIEAPKILSQTQQHIISNLLGNKFDVLELKNQSVFPLVCEDALSESQFVCCDISSKIKQGARFSDFVINCSALEIYAPILRKCFNDFNIPFWIDLPFNFKDSELYKFVNSVFDVVLSNFFVDDVLKLSKNIFLNLSFEEQMLFEKVVKKFGISYDMLFEKFSTKDESYPLFVDIVKKAFLPIKTFKHNIKLCKTVGEFVVCLQNFLKEMKIEQTLENLCEQNRQDADLWNESINRQVLDKFNKSLDNLFDIMAEFECDFSDFCSILNAGLDILTVSPLPMAVDCVYVGQNLQSIFEPSDHLYIMGAFDGGFPAMVSDVGIISDLDIKSLEKSKIDLSPTISEVNLRSVLNVVQNVAMFNKTLHISYALQSKDGARSPSLAFLSLKQIFSFDGKELDSINVDEFLNDNENFDGEQNKLIYLWGNLKNALPWIIAESNDPESVANKKLLSTAIKILKEKGFGEVLLNLDKTGTAFANKNQLKSNMLEHKQTISVTELERYFQCPYLHFVDYGLKLATDEISDISSIDNGNIIHAVMEKFALYYKKCPQITDEQIKKVVFKIFDEILNLEEFERFLKTDKNRFALKKLKNECVNACKAIVYQLKHSKYQIKFVEKSFGAKDFVAMPEIAVLNKTIKVKGKVDRLDEWNGRYRIIDYKTSKNASDFNLLDLYLGKKIQLFFYLNSILEGLKQKGENALGGGVYYLPIHRDYLASQNCGEFDGFRMDGITVASLENLKATDDNLSAEKLKSSTVDLTLLSGFKEGKVGAYGEKLATDEQFKAMLGYSNKIATNAVKEIFDGFVEPKPLDGVCKYCAYKHICKISCKQNPQARATNYKVKIQSFKEIEE